MEQEMKTTTNFENAVHEKQLTDCVRVSKRRKCIAI